MKYEGFSHSERGNIFTLVQNEKKCNFPRSLELIAKWIGIKDTSFEKPTYPFSGFYRKLIREEIEPETFLEKYSEDLLPDANNFSYKFFKDGIGIDVQEEYGIRYSHEDDSILIPIYDYSSNLVGVKARNNSDEDFSKRWYAWLPYAKNQVLYGWCWNYKYIVSKKTVFIVESEKAVGQLATMGIRQSLAIGGHYISNTQARYIKSLNVEKVVVCFDEGLEKEEIEYESKKLIVDNRIFKNKVGYVYDYDNKYLEKDSKDSPTDNGIKIFKELVKERINWL